MLKPISFLYINILKEHFHVTGIEEKSDAFYINICKSNKVNWRVKLSKDMKISDRDIIYEMSETSLRNYNFDFLHFVEWNHK